MILFNSTLWWQGDSFVIVYVVCTVHSYSNSHIGWLVRQQSPGALASTKCRLYKCSVLYRTVIGITSLTYYFMFCCFVSSLLNTGSDKVVWCHHICLIFLWTVLYERWISEYWVEGYSVTPPHYLHCTGMCTGYKTQCTILILWDRHIDIAEVIDIEVQQTVHAVQ